MPGSLTPRLRSRRDVGLVLGLAVLSAALVIHGAAANHVPNVDQRVYRDTLRAMHAGASYYSAMADALVTKEGAVPNAIHAIRPPSLFWILSPLPEPWWRIAGVVPTFFTLLGAYVLATYGSWKRGLVAVVLVAHWLYLATTTLNLHGEFWGLPLLMWAVVALKYRSFGPAIALLLLATSVRELYGLAFVLAVLLFPCKRQALVGLLVFLPFAGAHGFAAAAVTDPAGSQPALNGIPGIGPMISTLTFSLTPLPRLLGLLVVFVSVIVIVSRLRQDRIALFVGLYCLIFAVVNAQFGRIYWGLCYGPLLWCFAPLLVTTVSKARAKSRVVLTVLT